MRLWTRRSTAARSAGEARSARARRATDQHRSRWACAVVVPPVARRSTAARPSAYRSTPAAPRSTYQPQRRRPGSTSRSIGGTSSPAADARTLPAANTTAARNWSPVADSPHSSVRPGRGRTSIPGESGPSSRSMSAGANVVAYRSATASPTAGSTSTLMCVDPPSRRCPGGSVASRTRRPCSAHAAIAAPNPCSRGSGGDATSATSPSASTAKPDAVRKTFGSSGWTARPGIANVAISSPKSTNRSPCHTAYSCSMPRRRARGVGSPRTSRNSSVSAMPGGALCR